MLLPRTGYPGNLSTGGIWSNGNGVGTLTSVPGYNLTVNATTIHIDDFNYLSTGGPYTLNARGLLETDDGDYIGLTGEGLLANTPHVQAILANETGVEPLKWGELNTFTTWTFQAAASSKYAALTESTFVANIRMSPSDNKNTSSYIDYRLSQVTSGPLCED
ncbi:MAG: hypothetical protein Q9165_007406 [Trypethelium subeluteriae]